MWPFRRKIGGLIGKSGLTDWWLNLTEEERTTIRKACDPENRFLLRDSPHSQEERPLAFFTNLARSLNRPATRHTAQKVLLAAERLLGGAPILDQHFYFQVVIETFYPERDRDPAALAKTVWACQQQIRLAPEVAEQFRYWPRQHLESLRQILGDEYATMWAREHKDELEREYPLPAHVGYAQLAIILEKQGRYDEAIAICRQAMTQGWAGEWDRRIARLERKRDGTRKQGEARGSSRQAERHTSRE